MSAAIPVSAGDRFGRLVVLRELESVRTPNGTVFRRVECRCDCGVVRDFRLPMLRNGNTRSCGCLMRDHCAQRLSKHGGTGTPEYAVWLSMRARCADLSNKNYGGRGIRVCDRWQDSFEAFLEDMGPRPSPKHSIDRYPDKNGNYEPSNCRWATSKQQARNTRDNRMVSHGGETMCVAAWAARYGISPSVLCNRLNRGWDFENAVSTPPGEGYRCGDGSFYRTPLSKRDAAWYREYERREHAQ